jgi:predicted ATPase
MERAAGFQHEDGSAAKVVKLLALLAAAEPQTEDVALIAELHSLPSGDLAPPLDVTPQRKKEKTFEALLRQVEGLSSQQPALMVFDDLHWIDPSSRELLDHLIERGCRLAGSAAGDVRARVSAAVDRAAPRDNADARAAR